MAAQDPSDGREASAKDFHLKEFELLRKAHDAAEERLVTIIQYLLLFSAAVYTFLLDRSDALPKKAVVVWSLPLIASALGGAVLLGILRSIKLKDKYFRELECCYRYSEKLGWEHFKEQPGNPGYTKRLVPLIAVIIVGLNLAACVLGILFELSIVRS